MFSSSSATKDMPLSQQQIAPSATVYDLNTLLDDYMNEPDNFDISLLNNTEYFVDQNNNQEQKRNFGDQSFESPVSIEIDNYYQPQYMKKEDYDWTQQQPQYYFNSSSLLSPLSPSTGTPSPSPSLDYSGNQTIIKQEQNHQYLFLPPSPPDSNGVPSPAAPIYHDNVKIEPFDDIDWDNLGRATNEHSIDINYLLKSNSNQQSAPKQDNQVLREYLQDTTFQRRHNLKPLALESLLGDANDFEPVISLALEHAKREVTATCSALNIPADPVQWSELQVQLWINSTIKQFKLTPIDNCELVFMENGEQLVSLSDEEFIRRVPQSGSILHAQLEIWKAALIDAPYIENNILATSSTESQNINNASPAATTWSSFVNDDMSEASDDETGDMDVDSISSPDQPISSPTSLNEVAETPATLPTPKATKKHQTMQKRTGAPTTSSHIHLWQFLKELLASPQTHGTAIRWLDRTKGIFKIEDSVRVARLWGRRKNRPAMNYDKLSRSIRQYYKKGIMKKTERSQRLVYQFCHPYCL